MKAYKVLASIVGGLKSPIVGNVDKYNLQCRLHNLTMLYLGDRDEGDLRYLTLDVGRSSETMLVLTGWQHDLHQDRDFLYTIFVLPSLKDDFIIIAADGPENDAVSDEVGDLLYTDVDLDRI